MNKDIKLIDKIKPMVLVCADENMLNTVLRNLVSNAIKFTKSGGSVEISCKVLDDFAHIKIKDTGIGIAHSDIDQLFCIDKKISTSGTNNEQGSGLGLILCKDFIEKQGGTIKVESELKIGTTIVFTIPVYSG